MRKVLFVAPLVIALLLLLTVGTASVSAYGTSGSGPYVPEGYSHYPPPPPPPQWDYHSGGHCCSKYYSGDHYYDKQYYNDHDYGKQYYGKQYYGKQYHEQQYNGNYYYYGDKYFADQYYKYYHGGYGGSYKYTSPSCDNHHYKNQPCVTHDD